MKMRVHTYFKRCMVFFATLCVILISNHSVTWAASVQGNSPMLMVDKYTVENEKIVPGQDFTLTLTLKNYSNTNYAQCRKSGRSCTGIWDNFAGFCGNTWTREDKGSFY